MLCARSSARDFNYDTPGLRLLSLRTRSGRRCTRQGLNMFASAADSWAGCDRTAAFKLRVAEQTRAEKEGRTGAPKARPQLLSRFHYTSPTLA